MMPDDEQQFLQHFLQMFPFRREGYYLVIISEACSLKVFEGVHQQDILDFLKTLRTNIVLSRPKVNYHETVSATIFDF
jgi:hypothetical protein